MDLPNQMQIPIFINAKKGMKIATTTAPDKTSDSISDILSIAWYFISNTFEAAYSSVFSITDSIE
jgi:hypothetical protein